MLEILANIMARVEALEVSKSTVKRAPRSDRKTGTTTATTKSTKTTSGGDDVWDKVKNAMLYTRRKFAESEEFRNKLLADEDLKQKIEDDEKVQKKPEGEARYLEMGRVAWKEMSKDQKDKVRAEFGEWKKNRTVENIPKPLQPEETGEEGETANA
jgi:hypothetical protein